MSGRGDYLGVKVATLFKEKNPKSKVIAMSAEDEEIRREGKCDAFIVKDRINRQLLKALGITA